nr:MAG TPA: DNA-directed RNA polymerase [Caudoviricetes sp.]
MAEYIDREAANLALAEQGFDYDKAKQALDCAPAADVVSVVHGRWISFLDGDHIMPERYYRCSRCGRVESRRQPYCHCGAKMDGGTNNAESV